MIKYTSMQNWTFITITLSYSIHKNRYIKCFDLSINWLAKKPTLIITQTQIHANQKAAPTYQ